MASIEYSRATGKLIRERKPEVEKISCETPFKFIEVNDAVPVVVGLLRQMTEAGLQLDLSSSTSLALTTLRD
jgi:hypothetical protein